MLPLADAAVCRSEADWLVGINGTRAMTAFNSKAGGFHMTTVGRVQTPTLAILVEREEKIRAFVAARLLGGRRRLPRQRPASTAAAGSTRSSKKATTTTRRPRRAPLGRGAGRGDRARNAWASRASSPRRRKPTTQLSPLLFDLTSLQREANGRFGFSARTTLSLAQALYEKHKVLTYPRTDSRALPEDYLGTVKATLESLAETNAYGGFARTGPEGEVGAARTSASSTTPRSPTTSPSSRRWCGRRT